MVAVTPGCDHHHQAHEPDPPNSPTGKKKREAGAAAETATAAAAGGGGRAPQRRRSSLGGGGGEGGASLQQRRRSESGAGAEEPPEKEEQQQHDGDHDDAGKLQQQQGAAPPERRRSSAGGGGDAATTSSADDEEDEVEDEEEEEEIEERADDRPQRVDDGLFIGAWAAERDLAALRRRGITHVLQAADGLFPTHPLDLSYKILRIADEEDEDIVAHFAEAFAFIDAARVGGGGGGEGGKGEGQPPPQAPSTLEAAAARALNGGSQGAALVVCAAGVSRSASVCLGWLMRSRGWPYDRALAGLRDVRPWVAPNKGFEAQLRRFEALGADPARWRGWAVEKGEALAG